MQIHKPAQTPSSATQTADLRPLFRMHAELCKAMANEHRQAILHIIC
jgi:hypothetical protein